MTSLLTHFDALVTEGRIHADPMQRQVMLAFDAVVSSCIKNKHWLFPNRNKGVTGLYLYGEVGVGKTFLMDLFYHEVPIRKKKRYHLYPFMQQIDSQLRRLQGHADPLKRIAKDLSKTTQLLCFDEFMVHDVATAMMLAELLHYLFEYGVVLVATSNIKPDDLYLNGLQRARFLPAIALIKTHCRVMQMPSIHDYRLDHTTSNVAYYFPLGYAADRMLATRFSAFCAGEVSDTALMIQGRLVPCVKRCTEVIWFDFSVICNIPRSQLDYIEIATRFKCVIVSNIPKLTEENTTMVLLLMHLVDILYDQKRRLIVSAAVSLASLYTAGPLLSVFQRTQSRLTEMTGN